MAKGKKKTHNEFFKEMIEKFGDIYEFLTLYKTQNKNITVKHKKCNYIFTTTPKILLNGNRNNGFICPKCSNVIRHTTYSFKERVYELTGIEYSVVGNYINNHTLILMQHNTDEGSHQYEVIPKDFLNKNVRCSICFRTHKRTTEEFKQVIYELEKDKYILINKYIDSVTKLKFKHLICNQTFECTPSEFIHDHRRCPCLNARSKGENRILEFYQNNRINYIEQHGFEKCKDIKILPFDFAIIDKENKIMYLIEYDGEQHFKPIDIFGGKEKFIIQQIHDQIKNEYCRKNDIKLYRIPYWEFVNIELILKKLIHNDEINVDENFIVRNY